MVNRHFHYSALPVDEDDDHDLNRERRYDPRFDYSPKTFNKIPWKSIALAVFLLCLGSLLLFLSFFILTGQMGGEQSPAYRTLVLGILTFLPAFMKPEYHIMGGGVLKDIALLPSQIIHSSTYVSEMSLEHATSVYCHSLDCVMI